MPAAQMIQNQNSNMDDSATILKEIEKLKSAALEPGEVWFVVDCHWYRKMTDYLQGNGDVPGPIDNSGLFQDGNTSLLKETLQDELDYVLVPERAWNLLKEKFGIMSGQEPIPRKVIATGMFVKHSMVEVYPLELNLQLYSDSENVVTVPISRMATPKDLKKEARTRFQLGSAAQIRLFQKMDNSYEAIPEEKAQASLHDLCLTSHQTVVIDVEENGKWHIDSREDDNEANSAGVDTRPKPGTSGSYRSPGGLASANKIVSGESTSVFGRSAIAGGFGGATAHTTPGLCGLTNLGNTCFMNSALQCMVNAGPLTDYFLSDKYKEEINETNPLGMHGEIAQTFGELVKQMWSGRHSSVIPRAFKSTVGRFAPQFSGYAQQDSQELMAFLLDGLHEDLNRVRQKPYVEVKDADGQPDELVASEAWNNYKKRNDSVIVDLFHGLLKSTVVCPECDKISVTFDPFCYLSLPLPAKKERQLSVQFVPLNTQQAIQKCKVTVPKGGTVKDLTDAVGRLFNVDSSRLLACDIYSSRTYKVFESSSPLTQVMDRDMIYVYELDNVPQSEQPVVVILYNRVEKKGYLSSAQWTLVGLPMPVVLPKSQLTYQHLKDAAEKAFRRFMTAPSPADVWWRPDTDSDSGVEENGDNGAAENSVDMEEDGAATASEAPPLFTLRVVNSQGTSVFEDIQKGSGPTAADHTSGEIYVSLDWHPAASEKFLDQDSNHYIEDHESLNEVKIPKKSLSLADCLDLFTTTEKLGEHDLWYCPRCKKHQQATKKFDIWSLPEIMIIHLKRFSYTRLWRDKIEGLIEYPLRDLDLNSWVINKNHQAYVYDLIAVSNHYGGLGGGHYTAYAKNKITGKWYSFDDSSVSQIGEENVVTKSGYVLVYSRRRGAATIDANTDPNVEMEEGDE